MCISFIVADSLFFFFSEEPREFLIEQLEHLKISQQSGVKGPNLFNNANLDAVYGILDPTNQKYITFAQYKQGEHRTWGLLIFPGQRTKKIR